MIKGEKLHALLTRTTKVCSLCKCDKALSDFTKDGSRFGGRSHRCKTCDRARYKTSEAGRRSEAFRHEYAEKHPHVLAAWRTFNHAKNKGLVTPWPVCAVPECCETRLQAHHPDYSRPLDVVWLCQVHHKAAHKAHL